MGTTSHESWLFVFQMLQGIGQIGSVLVAFYALYLVQNYTINKDQADFLRNRWNEQTQLNMMCLNNDEALCAHEEIVYGQKLSDKKLARKFFVIFSILNQVLHLFIAMRHGVLEKNEFEDYAIQTLRLIKCEQSTVIYLLSERGYSKDFRDTVLPLLEQAIAPKIFGAGAAATGQAPVGVS